VVVLARQATRCAPDLARPGTAAWNRRQGADAHRAGARAGGERHPADLFIAHNLGALPIAIDAARQRNARVGFDAEDFHSGQLSPEREPPHAPITESIERRCLPACDYVTAAAPLIADAYASLCHIATPAVILNVFHDGSTATVDASRSGHAAAIGCRLYWFSQTIGPDRGSRMPSPAIGLLAIRESSLHLRGRGRTVRAAAAAPPRRRAFERATRCPSRRRPDAMVALAADMDIGLALEPPASR
jgi:hypothetical protein